MFSLKSFGNSLIFSSATHFGMLTTATVVQAKEHGYVPTDLIWSSLGMLVAAFLPPTARVLGFASGIGVIIAFHYQTIMNLNLVAQLALYLTGGISFLRYVTDSSSSRLCFHTGTVSYQCRTPQTKFVCCTHYQRRHIFTLVQKTTSMCDLQK